MNAAVLSEEHPHAQHVAVLAPFGRDGAVLAERLTQAAIPCLVAHDFAELRAYIARGIGAVIVTEEALTDLVLRQMRELLGRQPPWSDLPILLLLAPRSRNRGTLSYKRLLAMHGLVVHDRPIPTLTLVSATRAALSARRRQLQVRDLLAREHQARVRAELATRLRDEFLALVSHEVRTPLTAISMWAQLLADGHLDATQNAQAVRAILSSAETQGRLIEDLLDLTRIINGKLRIKPTPQRITPIVRTALALVRPVADAAGVRLELDAGTDADWTCVDELRAQQILWNVISNAVKFTKRGGTVIIRVTREPDWVCLSVQDDGQGIASDLLPHVFERFRQDDATPLLRHGGLGLGLAIVRQLVELHDGMIDAASEGKDEGTRVQVRLPAVDADTDARVRADPRSVTSTVARALPREVELHHERRS